jgi:hypothetical protein
MSAHGRINLVRHRVLVGIAILGTIVGLAAFEGDAADDEDTRTTLRRLSGIRVLIESLEPDMERAGLSQQQLQTDVELQLRHAGLRVLTTEEWAQVPGRPWLYVNVQVLVIDNDLAVYGIRVEVNQDAHLAAHDAFADVATWDKGGIGATEMTNLPPHVRNSLRDLVDEFIAAYLSVNPHPVDSTTPALASLHLDLLRQVQQRPQAVGSNSGGIDGAMGPQTRKVRHWFQHSKGLRPPESRMKRPLTR